MNRVPRRHDRGTVSVFVGRLHIEASEDLLRDLFQGCGEIVNIFIQTNVSSNSNFGYGFVRFRTLQEAQKAVKELNGWHVKGTEIKVELSEHTKAGDGRFGVQTPNATNEDYINLSRLIHAVAETTKVSEASDTLEVVQPEQLLPDISNTTPALIPLIRHPARRTLDIDHLDQLVSEVS